MVAKSEVVVALVVVELIPVKFWSVVEPRTSIDPVESIKKTEVVAFEPSLASAEIKAMLELVDDAEMVSLARGVVVPMPTLPALAGTEDTLAPL